MKRYSLCPICGDESLHENHQYVLREFEGFKKQVEFHVSSCDSCGSETFTEKQATFNKRQMSDFYREADGLLTGRQIRCFREALGITQIAASKLFGGGKNAFTKYENGDVTQSVAMDKLIRTAYAIPAALEFLHQGCPDVAVVSYNASICEAVSTLFTETASLRLASQAMRKAKPGTIEMMVFQPDQKSNNAHWEISPAI
ncbi:type II toxin-antitoxin system MqsA family antitoxin [Erwinia sp. P7711]|uniref:type II toxin-antitoxin system MqsA family antitoxin n=1 Tax=Erwinia sp. P7711 TaxID=3141451 RepID=UPI003188EB3C